MIQPYETTAMHASSTNASRSAWQPTKRRLWWAASVLGCLSIAASLVLLTAVCILGVAEVGPYGLLLFALAPAIVLGRCLFWVAPHARAAARCFKPRFGLRTLLLTMTIGGLALAWVGNRMRDVYHQRQITKRIFASGFYVGFQDVSSKGAMPRWVYRYFGMNGAIAYGGLETVGNNKSVNAEDLAALDGLRYRRLCLNFSSVTDDDLLHLKPDKNLRKFEAQSTGLRDNALAHLAQFEGLESIDVRITGVSDTGIAQLVRLKRLKVLILTDTAITDAAVPHLKAMPQLQYLFLHGTAVTPQAAAELRRALPDCNVDITSTSGAAYPPEEY